MKGWGFVLAAGVAIALLLGIIALSQLNDARSRLDSVTSGLQGLNDQLGDLDLDGLSGQVGALNGQLEGLSGQIEGLALGNLQGQIDGLSDQIGSGSSFILTADDLGEASDEMLATQFFELVNREAYQFTWHYETDPPPGFYEGNAPHGGILRAYLNNVAYDAVERKVGAFPHGSILVKENHVAGDLELDRSDEDRSVNGFAGNLDSVTLMVKIEGYNPEVGDWFWAKLQPDGTIDAAGKPAGCIGCHTQVVANNYVFDAQVTEASAMSATP
jgi:hypothetical protein